MFKAKTKIDNLTTGRLGESAARNFLSKKGYEIIQRNYRTKYLEIDLIAVYKRQLVFIEVKTRVGEARGFPEDAFTNRKIKRLIRNAAIYTAFNEYRKKYQIDAVCIVLDDHENIRRITHYPNITG